nr:protein SDA1 homolog [Quercus suber]
MKNANAKGFDKDRKKSSSSHFKSQDRGKNDVKDVTIGKSKALATTLIDTEPKNELDESDDEGILNAFTATVNPTEGIIRTVDDEEDLARLSGFVASSSPSPEASDDDANDDDEEEDEDASSSNDEEMITSQ